MNCRKYTEIVQPDPIIFPMS